MTQREITEIINARPASDGDGVKLKRVFGGAGLERFDPFLMMDEFGSDKPGDYSGGFPSHPHRGFETITYMLEGHMEHKDHLGNVGDLQNGDVQWMTAGAGIIHSEMPKQTEGRMRGFQIWLNLPANEKMQPAAWRDIAAVDIPVYEISGVTIKAIAGTLNVANQALTGTVLDKATQPGLFDLTFPQAAQGSDEPNELDLSLPSQHTALLYVYEGVLELASRTLRAGQMARLGAGDRISVRFSQAASAVLLTGRPLREPIVSYGPFVMNTKEEIEKALNDYRQGQLTT